MGLMWLTVSQVLEEVTISEFSDPAGDQVAVLRTEVDNYDAFVDRLGVALRFGRPSLGNLQISGDF